MTHDYGTIAPLCDIKGCIEAQTGEVIEIMIAPELWVRVCPCGNHGPLLARLDLMAELERLRDAVDVFWAEAGAFTVQLLKEERPDVIELAQDLHEARYHS